MEEHDEMTTKKYDSLSNEEKEKVKRYLILAKWFPTAFKEVTSKNNEQ